PLRRREASLQLLLLGCLLHASPVRAAKPPVRTLLRPANPGGGWDLTGRALGVALVSSGQAASMSYENRGGAAGAIGLAQFANAYGGDPHALTVMGAGMLGGIITGKPPVGLAKVRPLARPPHYAHYVVLPHRYPV